MFNCYSCGCGNGYGAAVPANACGCGCGGGCRPACPCPCPCPCPAPTPKPVLAYGGMYAPAAQTVALTTANTYVPITLGTALPGQNVTAGTGGLTITQSGVYEIAYQLGLSSTLGATAAAAVRLNGAPIPATRSEMALVTDGASPATYRAKAAGLTIAQLQAGDVLDLAVAATGTVPTGLTLTTGTGADAVLMVKKIG